MESGKRYYGQSPVQFAKHGQSGADMAENWTHLAKVADDICFLRGCTVDSVNHPTAMYQMNCGNRFGGDPGIGAWVTYGLGSLNQDLPGFIVLLYNGSWDSHDFIERAHGNLVRGVDQPIAALITDLKQRGLLESTLIVWCGEFGRTPDNGVRGGTAYGRDHNPNAMKTTTFLMTMENEIPNTHANSFRTTSP